MSKRSPLTFNLDQASAPAKPVRTETRLPTNTQTRKQINHARKAKKIGRTGRQFVAAHILPEAAKQFKLLAIQQEQTTQMLLIEAINDLFAKYGLSRIADE